MTRLKTSPPSYRSKVCRLKNWPLSDAELRLVRLARHGALPWIKFGSFWLADRMDALKLARKFESPKIALPTIHTKKQETDRREAWRAYEIAERELKIVVATKDTPPPGWDDDLRADSYAPPPEGWPGEPPDIPLKALVTARRTRADRMEQERLASPEATPEEKQAIRASISRRMGNGNGQGN